MTTAPIPVRWRLSSLAETDASDHASAACYRLPENVGIFAIVVAKLKFGKITMQMLLLAMLIDALHSAFKDREIAFN